MKFYSAPRPEVDEVTMCTVTQYNDQVGFEVNLDEYDLTGFVVLIELHSKKIRGPISSFLKVGDQLPLMVLDSGTEGQVYLSKKDVKPAQIAECKERFILNNRLFHLIQRLPDSQELAETIQDMNSPHSTEEDHLWTLLQNREWDKLDGLTESQLQLFKEQHFKLFGSKPQSIRAKFTIHSFAVNGNEIVRDHLIKIRDMYRPNKEGKEEWTNDELYEDTSRCNLVIQPIAIPTFQMKATAYEKDRCAAVLEEVRGKLRNCDFDYIQFPEK